MIRRSLVVLVSVLALGGALRPVPAFSADDALVVALPGGVKTFSLADLRAKLKSVTVTIDDPVYHAKKTFDGFRLPEVLALAGLDPKSSNDEIVFTAKDGYSPNTSFETLRAHSAVLAYQEHGGARGHFGKVEQGKAKLSPAPYYLVWEEGKALESVPWPYQLVKIEVVRFATKYAALYPAGQADDSGVMKGFRIFKTECIRCHSVNLQGGDLGPELNVPKNVVEYWDRKTLKEFIANTGAFRARDKMPPFPQLKPEDLDHVLEYFDFMKTKKAKL
jgi:mono/diheme cytochrome c family protein